MKYIKIIFLLCAFTTFFYPEMSAQANKVKMAAKVVDVQGNPIPGAIILSEKDQTSSITDIEGQFVISVDENSLLSVKATNYKANKVFAKPGLAKIVLNPLSDDMVDVAFNKVNKTDLTGGVSAVNIERLMATNFMTYSLDNLAAYIPGYHDNIWGNDSKLVLVDGVPRDEYNVIPAEIDKITVLKSSAALALYGSRAAKGVVSITTKRGGNKGSRFDVRVNAGLNTPKRYAQYLNSADYMTLYNEARVNDGLTPLYADNAEIEKYRSGVNPYRYPNLDFYSSDYLKSFTNRTEVITEYTGGNESTRYYVNIGNYNTTSLLNFGNAKNEGENRFNVRGNLDIKFNDIITSKINTSVTFYDNKYAQGNYWSNAATMRPNLFSPLIPVSYLDPSNTQAQAYVNNSSFLIDGKYLLGGISNQTTNPFADIYTRGYRTGTTRKYQFDASVNFNLEKILKGLTFDTQFAIDYNTSYNRTIGDNAYAVYAPTWNSGAIGSDTIKSLTIYGADNAGYTQSLSDSYQRQTMFFSGAFKYNNTFSKDHNVSAMLLAHAYTLLESQVYHAYANANLGLQANYNYKQKYYFDFTGNVVHSAKLASGKRDAFSPTVSLGWRISKEDFLAQSDVVNDLKITASAGILNTDIDLLGRNLNGTVNTSKSAYYLYDDSYIFEGDWYSWQEGRQLRSTFVARGENQNLGFAKRKDFNVGFEASLFNNSLQVNGAYFVNEMVDIPLLVPNLYPSYLVSGENSVFLPYQNNDADKRKGFELGVNYNAQIQKVGLNIGFVATYYETEATKRSEFYTDSYQYRQGKALDGVWGLKNDGFYTAATVAAIDGTPANPSPAFGKVRPGDLKYIDVNGDGTVDSKDEVFLGRAGTYGAPLTLGLNVTIKWNNFSLFVLANSNSGGTSIKNGSYFWATSGTTAKYSEPMLGRWTDETTANSATYPRLTTTSGDNNFRNSDFWIYKNDRISLSRVQLSYDLPREVFGKMFLKGLGFYANGSDLLLIAKERKLMETNIGRTPQMRSFTLGVKAVF